MLRIELDWAGEGEPEYGTHDGVHVRPGEPQGPAGWPTIVVEAYGTGGADAGPALWGWLLNEYCGGDDDEASELAATAVWV